MSTIADGARIIKAARGGRITIPIDLRRELGIDDETPLRVRVVDGELRVTPMANAAAGSSWPRELYDYFAPVREEAKEKGYTEEQINGWIDEAVLAYRRERRD